MSIFWRGPVLVLAACALGPLGIAATCSFTCSGFGVDDINTITLTPQEPTFTTSDTAILAAIAGNNNFNSDAWSFSMAAQPIISDDLTNQIYSGWVVTNDPITGFNNKQYSRPVVNQDAGGANFELGYTNIGENDPLPGTVDFLQVFSQSINGGPTESFVDNGGDTDTPFYVASGGAGGVGANTVTVNDQNTAWLLDIPFDCENGLTGPDNNNPCAGGNDEDRLSANVNFTVFIATVTENNGVNNVTLYGGEQWGYSYTNADTPEPSLGLLGSVLMAGILVVARRREKKAAV